MTGIKKLPRVVILGYPNVGKSTLFNRLLGQHKALVHSLPGMTRDLVTGVVSQSGCRFVLVDTGGFTQGEKDPISIRVRDKAFEAARTGDLLIFLLDGQRHLSPGEKELFVHLKKLNRPILAVVNKIDNPQREPDLSDFYQLGQADLLTISAEHKINLDLLKEKILEFLPVRPGAGDTEKTEGNILKIAVVGRINVGKSSLINRLAGEDRLLVSEIPGTTRDSVDTLITRNKKTYCLVDTAGIRRFKGTSDSREKAGIIRAEKNIKESDVICLVMDIKEFPTRQDARIASLAFKSGKPLIIALNKWDLVEKSSVNPAEIKKYLFERLHFVDYAPLIFVSALNGHRIVKILELADEVYSSASKKIETAALNKFWEKFSKVYPPRDQDGSLLKIKYLVQRGVRPPAFILFAHTGNRLQPAYERFLAGTFRESFKLVGTPVIFKVRHG
ncbi:MAG: ribosome biogenesis GTPase Der [Acidobacteriota bacterium]|nr:ribosome biogenesis GTPase Der [Acidobacteriota bacterium]